MQQKLQALTRQQQLSRLRAQMAARNNTPVMLMSDPPGKPGISLLGFCWRAHALEASRTAARKALPSHDGSRNPSSEPQVCVKHPCAHDWHCCCHCPLVYSWPWWSVGDVRLVCKVHLVWDHLHQYTLVTLREGF